jgi:hypothetical protein
MGQQQLGDMEMPQHLQQGAEQAPAFSEDVDNGSLNGNKYVSVPLASVLECGKFGWKSRD